MAENAVDRARERHWRVAATALASLGSRGVGLAALAVTVPLTLHTLGSEKYGIWVSLLSFSNIIGFADLGIGSGLLNAVSEANGANAPLLAKRAVSSAFFMLTAVGVLLGLSYFFFCQWIPWGRVFSFTSSVPSAEVSATLNVFVACLAINIPVGIVQRIQLAFQEGFRNSLWQACGTVLSLLGLIGALKLHARLPTLMVVVSTAPLLAAMIQGLLLFRARPHLIPAWAFVDRGSAMRLLRQGSLFFIMNLAVGVAYASDNLVAAELFGAAAVTEYSITANLFSIPPRLLGLAINPLWPAYSEALARGDFSWVRYTVRRSMWVAALAGTAVCIGLVTIGPWILRLWVGPHIAPSRSLLWGLGIWSLICMLGSTISMFLNAMNNVKLQAICAGLVAVGALAGKISFARAIGIEGLVWGTLIAYVLLTGVPYLLVVPGIFRKLGVAPTG